MQNGGVTGGVVIPEGNGEAVTGGAMQVGVTGEGEGVTGGAVTGGGVTVTGVTEMPYPPEQTAVSREDPHSAVSHDRLVGNV